MQEDSREDQGPKALASGTVDEDVASWLC